MYSKDYKGELNLEAKKNNDKTINEMEELSKAFANCSAEKDTQWGKNVSLSLSHTHTLTFVVEILMKMVIIFADGADLWVPS